MYKVSPSYFSFHFPLQLLRQGCAHLHYEPIPAAVKGHGRRWVGKTTRQAFEYLWWLCVCVNYVAVAILHIAVGECWPAGQLADQAGRCSFHFSAPFQSPAHAYMYASSLLILMPSCFFKPADVERSILGDGCIVEPDAKIFHSVIGLRSIIREVSSGSSGVCRAAGWRPG